jgi:hypothetical protein
MIRLDSLGTTVIKVPEGTPEGWKNNIIRQAVELAVGCTCDYGSTSEEWDHCTVPCGSEGSIQYTVTPSGKGDNRVDWGYVAIWGDLRGFGWEEFPQITTWFAKVLSQLRKPPGFKPVDQMTRAEKVAWALSSFMIREAVLCIEVEGQDEKVLLVWSSRDEQAKESHVQPGS